MYEEKIVTYKELIPDVEKSGLSATLLHLCSHKESGLCLYQRVYIGFPEIYQNTVEHQAEV